jgi:hypothetical protein
MLLRLLRLLLLASALSEQVCVARSLSLCDALETRRHDRAVEPSARRPLVSSPPCFCGSVTAVVVPPPTPISLATV